MPEKNKPSDSGADRTASDSRDIVRRGVGLERAAGVVARGVSLSAQLDSRRAVDEATARPATLAVAESRRVKSTHTLVVKPNGTLWAWGANPAGQLGLGDYLRREKPEQVGSDTDWLTVAGSHDTSLAIKNDGSLWAWGHYLHAPFGQGPAVPTRVGTDSDWLRVATDGYAHVAIKRDGSLWAWGLNLECDIPVGHDFTEVSSPVKVGEDMDWRVAVLAGMGGRAVKQDGTLWAWGVNILGELGFGDTTRRQTPAQLGSRTDWVFVTANRLAFAITRDGSLWDLNRSGLYGPEYSGVRVFPARVGEETGWLTVATNGSLSYAIRRDGTLWAWGWKDQDAVRSGDSEPSNRITPTRVGGDTDWRLVATAGFSTFAIKNDGTLWAWGSDDDGQLGLGDSLAPLRGGREARETPTQVGRDSDWAVPHD